MSTGIVQNIQQRFAPVFQHNLANYLSPSTAFTIQGSGFTVISPIPIKGAYTLHLFGTSIQQAAPYISLVQGQLPRATNGEIEALLTPETARSLHVTVGSVMTLSADYFTDTQEMFGGSHPVGKLKLRIVGLFNVASASDAFWHGQDFQPINQSQQNSYTLLVPGTSFLAALDAIASTYHSNVVFSPQTYELTWRYYLNPSHVNIYQLDSLSARLYHLQADIATKAGTAQNQNQLNGVITYPYLVQISLFNPVLGSYQLPAQQDAITLITANPLQAILGVAWYAVIAVLVAILTMCLLLRRAATMDVLSLRRETARTTQVPFWQRFRLDVIAAVIALVGYAISLYITSIGALLDIQARILVATPLALVAPIFLLNRRNPALLALLSLPLTMRSNDYGA